MSEEFASFAEQKAAMSSNREQADSALHSAEESVKEWPKLMANIVGEVTPALYTARNQLNVEARSLGRRNFLKGLVEKRKSLAQLPGITWRDRRVLYARLWDLAVRPYIAWLQLRVWLWEHRRQIYWVLGLTASAALFIAVAILGFFWELMRR